jgi:predicted secreted protein
MSTEALSGVGTLFQRWNGANYVSISEIQSITGPGMSRDTIDVTSLSSTGGYREFIAGFRKGGTFVLKMNFVRENFDMFLTDYQSEQMQNFRVVLPDKDNTTIDCEALVTDFPMTIPTGAQITCDVTITISGQPVINSDFPYQPGSGSGGTVTRLSAPIMGAVTVISQTCLKIAVSGVDLRGTSLKLEYKKTSDISWIIETSTMFLTETVAEIFGLDPATSYDFRWTTIGNSNYVTSLPSTVASGTTSAYANPIYIDPSYGGGSNDGTLAHPWVDFPTLVAGNSYLLKRGTTLTRTSNVYTSSMGFNIGAYGTGARPKWYNNSTARNLWCAITTPGNMNIADIEMYGNTATSASAIDIGTNTSGIVNIINCDIHNCFQGLRVTGTETVNSSNATIRVIGCNVHHTWSDGLATWAPGDNIEVGYCVIHSTNESAPNSPDDGDGWHSDDARTLWCHHTIIDRYSATNKFCLGILRALSPSTPVAVVEYCLFRRNTTDSGGIGVYLDGTVGCDITIRYCTFQDMMTWAIENRAYNNKIYGNTFVNCGVVYDSAYDTSSTVFYNNTFYNCRTIVDNSQEILTFKNNIFHTITAAAFDKATNRISDYNTYYNMTNRVIALGTHDITTNPLFTSPTTGDFSLQSASPSKGNGVYIAGFTKPTVINRGSDLSLSMEVDSSGMYAN